MPLGGGERLSSVSLLCGDNVVKICAVTLGCDKNRVDTEIMLGLLTRAGFQMTGDEREADVILVNTCGFIDAAKEESVNMILELAGLKEHGRCKCLIVSGCLAQRYPGELRAEIPEIDALIGTGKVTDIVSVVQRSVAGEAVLDTGGLGSLCDRPLPRVRTTPVHTAYLKIAEGCNNRCGYCVIPSLRGPYRSRTMDSIIEEAIQLAGSGVREIILVAQDSTRYGRDLHDGTTLAGLLDRLAAVKGLYWIRLLYCYPNGISDELIETIRTHGRICRYLDIPMQHASDSVLKRMGRPTTVDDLYRLVVRLREGIDGLAIRSTFMLGFPGETEDDVDNLVAFLREARLERAGFFVFSPQEGTRAAGMSGQVSESVKRRRLARVAAVQKEISLARNRSLVGKELVVMAEGEVRGTHFGRTEADAPEIDGIVYFSTRKPVPPGELVPVRITGVKGAYDLNGQA